MYWSVLQSGWNTVPRLYPGQLLPALSLQGQHQARHIKQTICNHLLPKRRGLNNHHLQDQKDLPRLSRRLTVYSARAEAAKPRLS
jgi:hypothetical protein